MKYIELKIHASSQGVEMVTELLIRNGISSISVDDPADLDVILENKNEYGWDYIDDAVKERPDREPVVKAYLEDSDEGRRKLQELKEKIMNLKSLEMEGRFGWDADLGRLYAEAEVVDDEDWKDRWKEHFHPMRITDAIVIKPSWEDYDQEDAKTGDACAAPVKIIEIDPGMAFGTGTHETTRLCMQLMERYADDPCETGSGDPCETGSDDPCETGSGDPCETGSGDPCETGSGDPCETGSGGSPKCLLDVGCGSGILSIGGAMMGFDRVLGIEIDPDAVEVAKENVRSNGYDESIEIREGDLTEGVDFMADMVVANLMADLVMRLAEDCGKHLKDGGVFISSGILIEKEDEVAKAIEGSGFSIIEIAEEGEWCAIAAKKRG